MLLSKAELVIQTQRWVSDKGKVGLICPKSIAGK